MGTPDIDSEATTHAADSVTRQARHQRDRERIPESQVGNPPNNRYAFCKSTFLS